MEGEKNFKIKRRRKNRKFKKIGKYKNKGFYNNNRIVLIKN